MTRVHSGTACEDIGGSGYLNIDNAMKHSPVKDPLGVFLLYVAHFASRLCSFLLLFFVVLFGLCFVFSLAWLGCLA